MGSARYVYILPRPDRERTCEKNKVFGPCVLHLKNEGIKALSDLSPGHLLGWAGVLVST